ncbi:MAG: DEAD/DEAH box helicase family protein, partial [Chloroflexi bacterium]|nr:DEAD/DEAH box helicase family protein [Chloroflexota bacterium]
EYIGESYFNYLANLPDLVLLMDESHRYRASAGARAINELKPILGLELTATPYIETSKGTIKFKNIIYDYPLAQAMQDGFVKEPAVVTQKNFDPRQFTAAQLETIKLQDGVRLHEATKIELMTYAQKERKRLVKPFMLVIARDTTHASDLLRLIESEQFFEGRYIGKAIQVDSSKIGEEEDKMVTRLLAVEQAEEPTEIVIHVNMLKEGWDVTNLYTIVPLRAASARVLIEQSIGRGLHLPFGNRTGVESLDRLSIVAHDRFQEIIDEARRPDSLIKLRAIEVDFNNDIPRTKSVSIVSNLAQQLNAKPSPPSNLTNPQSASAPSAPALYYSAQAQNIANTTFEIANQFQYLPRISDLQKPEIHAQLVREVRASYTASPAFATQATLPIEATPETLDVERIVKEVVSLMVQHTIDIPRIVVVPTGDVTIGYHPFQLELSGLHLNPVSTEMVLQYLRSQEQQVLNLNQAHAPEQRPEDYIVRGLMDFNDIDYDAHADLLYDLARQVVQHLHSYLTTEADVQNVLQYYQKPLVNNVHTQMLAHRYEHATDYVVKVNAGFSELKPSAVTVAADSPVYDFRNPIEDKSRIGQMVFGGFKRCLYPLQKFDSNSERLLAVILDRDGQRWFRPVRDQFQIYYQLNHDSHLYQPDFVVEDVQYINMIECKSRKELESPETLSKAEAAKKWCALASGHARQHEGKAWRYCLIPHDILSESMSLDHLLRLHTK